MKNLHLVFACFFALQSIAQTSHKATKEIATVLNAWHKAAATANYQNYFDALDTNAIFIGTDAAENWKKEAFESFSKPYFDKGKAWAFTPIERNIYTNTAVSFAWFDELLNTHMGICRGSGVLEKIAGVWKIKHYVLSITIPNDHVKEITQLNKLKDSIFIAHKKPLN